jgi:hypothetical protein
VGYALRRHSLRARAVGEGGLKRNGE